MITRKKLVFFRSMIFANELHSLSLLYGLALPGLARTSCYLIVCNSYSDSSSIQTSFPWLIKKRKKVRALCFPLWVTNIE